MSVLRKIFNSAERNNRQAILRMTDQDRDATVLDCGCGDGSFTKELAARIGTDNVYGIEFMEELARLAESKGIKVNIADLNEKFCFDDGRFDFVCANQVIEEVYRTDLFIKEIYRVLKPNGYTIVSTNNLASAHNIVSLLFGKQPPASYVSNEFIVGLLLKSLGSGRRSKGSTHYRIFTCDALKELFEYNNFRVEKVVGVGYYPFPTMAAKLLSRLDEKHAAYLTMKARKVG